MNKKILLSILLFVIGVGVIHGQESEHRITIKGVIADSETGEPIMFANIGVVGTAAGTATNMEGEFELLLPDRYANNLIRVSMVGYEPYEIKTGDAARQPFLNVKLRAVVYRIEETGITAESLVYQRILRSVLEHMTQNYPNAPYNYQGHFEYSVAQNEEIVLNKEAMVTLYDNRGYIRTDVESAFSELNYKFNEVRRNTEQTTAYEGMTFFDDIITADIVRHTRNVLDLENIRDFKLKGGGNFMYEGDTVQVIAYEVPQPTLTTTGSYGVKACRGVIYVNLKDFAVIRNILTLTSSDYNDLGRGLVSAEGGVKKENAEITITTDYKKLPEHYFLSGVMISVAYREGEANKTEKMQYVTTRLNTNQPEVISGRMYYEDIEENEKFWEGHSLYFND